MRDLAKANKTAEVRAILQELKLHVYTPKEGKENLSFVEQWLKSRWARPEWIKILRNRGRLIDLLPEGRKAQVSK